MTRRLSVLGEAPPHPDRPIHLSNKGCRNYYIGKRLCRCPEEHCWFREQKARQMRGEATVRYGEWLDALTRCPGGITGGGICLCGEGHEDEGTPDAD
jgi:hypothetical protein